MNFDQRTEMRQMVKLSTSALSKMVGLTVEELNVAEDDEDDDDLETTVAKLRKRSFAKHSYEAALQTYRVSWSVSIYATPFRDRTGAPLNCWGGLEPAGCCEGSAADSKESHATHRSENHQEPSQ
jgi:hypothetical protein